MLAALLWLLAYPAFGLGHGQGLRLVADSWPPFTDRRLLNNGLATDLVSRALARGGYASEYHEVPWSRALQGVRLGSYDVLVNAWNSEARGAIGHFSSAYLSNRIRLLKRKNSLIAFDTLTDLLPYEIAVVRGYSYGPAFDQDARLRKVEVGSFATAVRMLHAGRVSLVAEAQRVMHHHLEMGDSGLRRLGQDLELLPKALSDNDLHILVSLRHPEHAQIVAAFDRGLLEMRADGSYATLFERHGLLVDAAGGPPPAAAAGRSAEVLAGSLRCLPQEPL